MEWFYWRPVWERRATLAEVLGSWSMLDLLEYHSVANSWVHSTREARERAEREGGRS